MQSRRKGKNKGGKNEHVEMAQEMAITSDGEDRSFVAVHVMFSFISLSGGRKQGWTLHQSATGAQGERE